MSINKAILKKFCDQVDLSPVFIERLAELYQGLAGSDGGLSPEEWQEYKEKARRFTDQMIQWLLKQREKNTPSEDIQIHKDLLMSYVNWRSQISSSRSIPEKTHVIDYLREFYVPSAPEKDVNPLH